MQQQQRRRPISHSVAILAIFSTLAIAPTASGQDHSSMPPGMSHEEHMKEMAKNAETKKRGDSAMGFDQDKVSHHFHLTPSGGAIEVTVNQTADAGSRKQIRDHLKTVSQEFADGVFTSPIVTHAEVPPGVPVMRERKSRIKYAYEETPDGARVIIATTDRAAKTAVHNFLRYQIREHATGDSISIQK
jgi:hypothetical protein